MWTEAHIVAEYEVDGPVGGLNAIGRKLLEMANVEKIVIQGSARATGRGKGTVPSKISFPHC